MFTAAKLSSLLTVIHVLYHPLGEFLLARYREVVETVLRFKDSKEKLIRRAVIALLPRLAAFAPERFAQVRSLAPGSCVLATALCRAGCSESLEAGLAEGSSYLLVCSPGNGRLWKRITPITHPTCQRHNWVENMRQQARQTPGAQHPHTHTHTQDYLSKCISHLLSVLRHPSERGAAFGALADMATSLAAVGCAGGFKDCLPAIAAQVRRAAGSCLRCDAGVTAPQ